MGIKKQTPFDKAVSGMNKGQIAYAVHFLNAFLAREGDIEYADAVTVPNIERYADEITGEMIIELDGFRKRFSLPELSPTEMRDRFDSLLGRSEVSERELKKEFLPWESEFGSRYDVPEWINDGVRREDFEDRSWRNDVCPNFVLKPIGHVFEGQFVHAQLDGEDLYLNLWVEHPDANMREMGYDRFSFIACTDDGQIDLGIPQIFGTEDAEEARKFFLEFEAFMLGNTLVPVESSKAFIGDYDPRRTNMV